MRTALLFKDEVEATVNATQVRDGEYSPHENFVDPEYQFRVVYIKDSKYHSGPYFRLYFARDYYISMNPERKSQYDILRGQRHYLESQWHRDWEEKLSSFCKIEYIIKNEQGERKRADAFYLEGKTAIEFQHSYIDRDFEGRNSFYGNLRYNIVWLYDLTMMNVVAKEDGSFEILENNAKGFFRVAENPANLEDYPVFIQVRGGTVYRVSKLGRKETQDSRKSTIRFFMPDATFSEEEFINGIKSQEGVFLSKQYAESIKPKGDSVYWLWKPEYQRMVVHNPERDMTILIYADGRYMNTDNETGNITYRYVVWNEKNSTYSIKSEKFYQLSNEKARARQWFLLRAFPKEK